MDWKSLITDLLSVGMTQAQIGAACGMSQAGVSDLLNERTKDPGWSKGEKLRALHLERCALAPKAA